MSKRPGSKLRLKRKTRSTTTVRKKSYADVVKSVPVVRNTAPVVKFSKVLTKPEKVSSPPDVNQSKKVKSALKHGVSNDALLKDEGSRSSTKKDLISTTKTAHKKVHVAFVPSTSPPSTPDPEEFFSSTSDNGDQTSEDCTITTTPTSKETARRRSSRNYKTATSTTNKSSMDHNPYAKTYNVINAKKVAIPTKKSNPTSAIQKAINKKKKNNVEVATITPIKLAGSKRKKNVEALTNHEWLKPLKARKNLPREDAEDDSCSSKGESKTLPRTKTQTSIQVGMTVSGKFGDKVVVEGGKTRRSRNTVIGRVMRCCGKAEWEVMFLDGTSEIKKSNLLTIEPDVDFDETFRELNELKTRMTDAQYRKILLDPYSEVPDLDLNEWDPYMP